MSSRWRKRFTDDEIERIRTLAEAGWTDAEIAFALGRTSDNAVGQRRRREGIESGQMRRYTPDEDSRIRELVAEGRSSREIAGATGRTDSAIFSRRTTEWIDAPRRGPLQIAAEARREAHIQMLRERKATRRAGEMSRADA